MNKRYPEGLALHIRSFHKAHKCNNYTRRFVKGASKMCLIFVIIYTHPLPNNATVTVLSLLKLF